MTAPGDVAIEAPPLLHVLRGRDREAIERHPRYEAAVLFVVMAGVAASSFANMLLVAALPAISDDLRSPTSVVAWVNIAPAIAFGVSMPLFGKLGDLYGHRRVFIWGWAVATVLAFATAFSPNVASLIVLRTASQLAGASTSPAAFGILARILAPADRGRAFARVVTVMSASPVIAIVVGGPLVDSIGWRPMFVGQAAIAAVAVIAAVPLLPETPRRPDVRFDIAGAMALTVAVVGLLFALNRVGDWGVDHRAVQTTAVLGAAGLAAFGFVERRAAEPLLRPSWLVRRDVGAAVATNLLVHVTLMGLSTTGAFMLRRVFGYGTGAVALLSGIRPAAFSLAASMSARHARTIGTRWVLLSGNVVLVVGCVVTAVGVQRHSIAMVVISIVLTGFGAGYGRPGLVTAITNAVDDGDAGVANGVLSMAGQLGSSVGQTLLIAVIGTSAAAGAFVNSAWTAAAFAALALVMSALIVYGDAAT
ncbi:MAG TPA: MFS transporter [Acidimicrobiales bacterium]|nr:MFS transporter [Acidimicrobiales bacterium]